MQIKARLAALSELLLVLAAGNVLGELLFTSLFSDTLAGDDVSEVFRALADGILILMRLGLAAIIGFSLLYWRRGLSPIQAGLTRNNTPVPTLLQDGLVVGLISCFLVASLFYVDSLFSLGEGLPAWRTYHEQPFNLVLVVSVLSTSVLIPPLVEETLFRGYARERMVESYGMMSGVILTGFVFGLSHTRYVSSDPMLALFMIEILISSTLWTYVAQKTGSVIPSMIAHGISNGVGTMVLFDARLPFFITLALVLIYRRRILGFLGDFFADARSKLDWTSLGVGGAIVVAVLISALTMLSLLGRTTTLVVLGVACLLYTSLFSFFQVRARSHSE